MKHKIHSKLFSNKEHKSAHKHKATHKSPTKTDSERWEMSSDDALKVNYVDHISSPAFH